MSAQSLSGTPGRIRLDLLLLERGLAPSRARARDAVLRGAVRVDGVAAVRPGRLVAEDARIDLATDAFAHVSRAGLKLAHGLDRFAIDPRGLAALDLGASTGGFTEVLLSRDAAKVYALDVGQGQLHPKLRREPRVISLEGLNARRLDRTHIPEPIDLIVADVSFISLKLALPAALRLAAPAATLVALIKPQFEAGREHLGKNGVVRSEAVRREVCAEIAHWLEDDCGWPVLGLADSPIAGAAGNRETLIAARRVPVAST